MNTTNETYRCTARDEDGEQCSRNSLHYGHHQNDDGNPFGENNGEQKVKYLRDIDPGYTFEYKPLWWHERGLSQTASGYGNKLTSPRIVRLSNGKTRRVYVTLWSNSGTAWVTINGEQYIVRDTE